MNKKLLFFAIVLCFGMRAYSQATSLTVDCQNPGWLSSKINYGDQMSVKKLKVTGYINSSDLKFIGTLIANQNLDETVDLSEVNVVNNTLENNCFGISHNIENELKLKYLSLPQTVESLDAILPYYVYSNGTKLLLHVDTLYYNCKTKYIKSWMFGNHQYDEMPHHFIVGENVDSIPDGAFWQNTGIKTIQLPTNMKYIGNNAFSLHEQSIESVNFNDLENLKFLGSNAFTYYDFYSDLTGCYQPDTIIIPRTLSNPFYLFAFAYKDGQHIFIEDNITEVSGYSQLWGRSGSYNTSARLHFHINNANPPSITNYKFSNSDLDLTTSFVYVPKGAKQAYLNSDWGHATIIEANPVESVSLNEHQLTLNKNRKFTLTVSIQPEDADNRTLIWSSSDEQVAKVDKKGNVTALKTGETWIYVESEYNPSAKDSCKVNVLQPVTGVTLDYATYQLNAIGESFELQASVEPVDASNQNIKWTSSNESVCIVSRGKVIAVGYGVCVIIANTEDGGYIATCSVTVVDGSDIASVKYNGETGQIYDIKGVRRSSLQRGVNIVGFSDGTKKKILVK